jgi:hypothetical protein
MTIKIVTKKDKLKETEEYRLEKILKGKFTAEPIKSNADVSGQIGWRFWPTSRVLEQDGEVLEILINYPTGRTGFTIHASTSMMSYAMELANLFENDWSDRPIIIDEV